MTDTTAVTLPVEVTEIQRLLPHRYPFLLVDRVVAFQQKFTVKLTLLVIRSE